MPWRRRCPQRWARMRQSLAVTASIRAGNPTVVVSNPMEIVVRTLHGEAAIIVGPHRPDVTMAALLTTVTGQAVPPVVLVDGRTVDGSTPIDAAGLHVGSVVETSAEPATGEQSVVRLRQIVGHGSGRDVALPPGSYRLGPGRRAHADELSIGPVDTTVIEITVHPDGDVTIFDETSDAVPERLGIGTSDRRCILAAGDRRFLLEAAHEPDEPQLPRPSRDGTISFLRTGPLRADRLPVVDAISQSMLRQPGLWTLRRWEAGALQVPAGLTDDGSVVTVDLGGAATAITGDEQFRYATARALLLEAVTLHGPADLRVVVATSHDRVALWEWATWLPHTRATGAASAPVMVLETVRAMERWATAFDDATESASFDTLLVMDEPSLWAEPGSPVRAAIRHLAGRHGRNRALHALVLCPRGEPSPAFCNFSITSVAGRARFTRHDGTESVAIASLVENSVALDAARALAPLVDTECEVPDVAAPEPPLPLDALLGLTSVDDVIHRWQPTSKPPDRVVIGHRDDVPVHLDWDSCRRLTMMGPDRRDVADVTTSVVMSMAANQPPDALDLLLLLPAEPTRLDVLRQLPHTIDIETDTIDGTRLAARLAHVLDSGADRSRRIVVLLAGDQHRHLITELDRLLESRDPGPSMLHVIVVEHGIRQLGDDGTAIVVDSPGGRRRATITGDSIRDHDFDPWDALGADPTNGDVPVEPRVLGRSPTPLERRLANDSRRSDVAATADLTRLVDWCREAAAQVGGGERSTSRAPLVPPPLPVHVELEELLDRHPGDGVPLGLVDRPQSAETVPFWWQPGDGVLLARGSPRSGITALVDALIVGIAARIAPTDLELITVLRSTTRQGVATSMGHVGVAANSDRPPDVIRALDVIEQRLADGAHEKAGGPLLVLFDDLAHTRRRLLSEPDGGELVDRLDHVLTAVASAASTIDVVAVVHDRDDAGALGQSLPGAGVRWLVPSTSDDAPRIDGGVVRQDVDVRGRCVLEPEGLTVQLTADLPSLSSAVAARHAPDRGPDDGRPEQVSDS